MNQDGNTSFADIRFALIRLMCQKHTVIILNLLMLILSFLMEFLLRQYPYEEDVLNEMLNLVVDTVCSKRKTIRIASDDKPLERRNSIFMKLDRAHTAARSPWELHWL